jgi:hypothetical protein
MRLSTPVRKSPFRVESIEVNIEGVEGHSVPEIRAFALEAAGETTASTFGSNVKVTGNFATVMIHRD